MRTKVLTFIVVTTMAVAYSSANSATWEPMVCPTTPYLLNVWGGAADDVFAVGLFGTILHYDGDGDNDGLRDNIWEQVASPTTTHLFGVSGSVVAGVYAVGVGPTVLHYDGTTWTPVTDLPIDDMEQLNDVWVTGPHVFGVGQGGHKGHIIHWDGSSWSHYSFVAPASGWDVQLHAVWGRGPEDVYASGHACISADVEAIVYHFDGFSWEVYYHGGDNDLPLARAFTSIWCMSESPEVFFAGSTYSPWEAMIAHYDGASWDTQVFSHSIYSDSIWGSALDNIYAGARTGKILHYDGSTWSDMETPVNGFFPGLWGTERGEVFAVGGTDIEPYDSLILHLAPPKLDVAIDINPGSCPNPLNVKSKGVLAVAVLGTEDFDVTTIDLASVRLAGVAPIRSSFEDVATPADGGECGCTTAGPDGYTDLSLKFNTEDIVNAIGEVADGELLELSLTGELLDGTAIEGSDCIVIIAKSRK